jgi:hypothetical protein
MATKGIHTVYDSQRNRWVNKQEKSSQPLSSHFTKDNAVTKGRRIAKKRKAEHVIHYQAGPIQKRNSYGNDPFPPKG